VSFRGPQPLEKGSSGKSRSGGDKKKSYPAMAVEEARKTDIERSVRFLQRLHDVEGGATQLPTAQSAYAAATAKLNAPAAQRRGGPATSSSGSGSTGPLAGVAAPAGGRVTMPSKKPAAESVRDKRAAYFNKMFAAEVGDGDL
jgi:hypothetical protein